MSASSLCSRLQDFVRKLFDRPAVRAVGAARRRTLVVCRVKRGSRGRTPRCPRTANCPCRAATLGVLRPRRGRQIAAVNRGASGRVGDDQPVAKELRQQFHVRRLAATGARSGELKQRLLHLLLRGCDRVGLCRRSISGIERKKFQFSRSVSRSGDCGCMLMAFSRASDLLRAGQTSTQMPQPVQSSTATCSVYFRPFHSGSRASAT